MSRRILILFLGVILTGFVGCSSHHGSYGYGKGDYYWSKAEKHMGGLVEKHVKDPEKVKQVNVVMGEIITEIKSAGEQQRQYHRALYELNANYSAPPEDFTKILDEANNSRMRSAAKILGLRFKMKTLLTAEEWTALSEEIKTYGNRYYGKGTDAPAPAASRP